MTISKLLSEIKYALDYILYTEEKEKEVKKAFKKLKLKLKRLTKLEKVVKIFKNQMPPLTLFKWNEEHKAFEYIDYDTNYWSLTIEEYALLVNEA